jgi:hypothetical protein
MPDLDHQVIYSVARDITERKRTEEEREKLLRELQTALAEVKRVTEDIADLLVLQEHPRRRELLADRRGLHLSPYEQQVHSICPTCYENVVESSLKMSKRERSRQRNRHQRLG